MANMKTSMNSIDIYAAVDELQPLVGYWLDNVYVNGDIYLFKFQGKGNLKRPLLLIEPGKRIHLTEIKREIPSPGPKTLQLRRLIKGARVSSIHQHEMDRMLVMDLDAPAKDRAYRLVVELFGKKPNLIVMDTSNANRIIFANWYRKMRDRDVLPGRSFVLPPTQGKFLLDITLKELMNAINKEVKNKADDDTTNRSSTRSSKKRTRKLTLVRFLATHFSGGGNLVEEILERSRVPKDIPPETLTEDQGRMIINVIEDLSRIITERKWSPCITLENGIPISVDPFPYEAVKGERRFFSTFNEALDKYFSELEQPLAEEMRKKEQEIAKWNAVLQQQRQHLEKLEKQQQQYQKMGDLLYEYFQEVSEIITVILQARKRNIDWETILEKIEIGKKKGMKSAKLIEKISPDTAEITLRLDDERVIIDFRKSVSENADEFYARAKKAQRKIEPARKKVEETVKKIEALKDQRQEIIESSKIVLKRRTREWYEKFHWIRTVPNDLLVIAGKDVKTNEIIAKKYLESNDLFFHADITGAPYTVLKIPSRDSTSSDIRADIEEAARLSAVFSKAWKAGYGVVDVYYVRPEQVSFSAPSGEFLPRGGIMIRGKRNYIKNVPLEWAVGILLYPHYARVIAGLPETIDAKTGIYVILKPGDLKKGQCAKKIKAFFETKVEEDDKPKVRALDLNEIVEHVPGNSKITKTIFNPEFYPSVDETLDDGTSWDSEEE